MVDVADDFHRGKGKARDVHKRLNRSIIGGKKEGHGHLQHIKSKRVTVNHPGKYPECGEELQEGESGVPL